MDFVSVLPTFARIIKRFCLLCGLLGVLVIFQHLIAKNPPTTKKPQNKQDFIQNVENYHSVNSLDSASLRDLRTKKPPKQSTKTTTNNKTPNIILSAPFNIEFDLEVWLPRLVQIVNSTDGSGFAVAVCGTCLLQAYQMAAEILHYGNNPPTQGGYFFDTAPHTNPFINFRQRNSILYDTLNDIIEYYVIPADNLEERFANSAFVTYASAISLLPQYHWQYLGIGATQDEINRILEQVFEGSVGSLYITSMTHRNAEGEDSHHNVLLVRTSGGVRVLQTNVTDAPDYYLRHLARENATIQSLLENLIEVGQEDSELIMIGISQVNGRQAIPFASVLSFSDCSGDGDSRRGNAQIPRASALNQCASGRCNQ